jgi:hypothetical protein
MRSKIILDKNKSKNAICDREEYFKKYGEYDSNGDFRKLQNGAPLIVNIDGTYYYYDKLIPAFGCITYDEYRRELKSPIAAGLPPLFIWK